jgi:hypothetical protein
VLKTDTKTPQLQFSAAQLYQLDMPGLCRMCVDQKSRNWPGSDSILGSYGREPGKWLLATARGLGKGIRQECRTFSVLLPVLQHRIRKLCLRGPLVA